MLPAQTASSPKVADNEFTKLDSRKRETVSCVAPGLLKTSAGQDRVALALRVPGPGFELGHH